jgi:4-amino-4-deoxy-L-arabinose transferase-like glycosyltransferase
MARLGGYAHLSRMSRSQLAIAVVAVTASLLWILQTTTVPTFDFDEALYRRIAEEMKQSGNYLLQTWDGRPFYEKPPTYEWMIVLASRAVDGPGDGVSIFACRLPSLLFSWATMLLLAWFWRRSAADYAQLFGSERGMPRWMSSPALPILAYNAALLPVAGAGCVLLDPMLTFFLTVPLMLFARATMRSGSRLELTTAEAVMAAVAMAAATATKGLIGLILPAVAVVIHIVLSGAVRSAGTTIRRAAPAFAGAAALATLFYGTIYLRSGPRFFYEFFVRQHFGRGFSAMQGHTGPFFYHPLVVLLFGGALVSCVLLLVARKGPIVPYARWAFPLSWIIAVIVFYSLMATKLPNYTWPVWPGLSIAVCILGVRSAAPGIGRQHRWQRAAAVLALAAPVLLFSVSMTVASGLDPRALPLRPRTRMMVSAFEPMPGGVRVAFFVAGVMFLGQYLVLRRFRRSSLDGPAPVWQLLAASASLNAGAMLVVCLAIVPYAARSARGPLVQLAREAAVLHQPGGTFTTVGLFSPTVSSSYLAGQLQQIGTLPLDESRFARPGQHLVLAPVWAASPCSQRDFRLLQRASYLVLCENRR